MKTHTKPSPLKGFIYMHFGGFQPLANILDIATSTVSDWTTSCPRNALKYMPEISEAADIRYDEFVKAVLDTENQIK